MYAVSLKQGKLKKVVCTFHKNVGLCIFLEKSVNLTKPTGMQMWGEGSLLDRLGKECGFIYEKEYLTDSFKIWHQGL